MATAATLVKGYTAPSPLHLYLKKYFSANKKHGSRDRKIISALCYSYFRLGKNFESDPIEKKLLAACCLCHPEIIKGDWLELLTAHWSFIDEDFINLPTDKKVAAFAADTEFSLEKIVPFPDKLSPLSDKNQFIASHFERPWVWLRAKKNKKTAVEETLRLANIAFQTHPQLPNAIGLPQATDVEKVLGNRFHHLAEVQDATSQLTGNFITLAERQKVWDSCCGAGGKSLMLLAIEHGIELYSSDVRPQIMENFLERFKLSGLTKPYTGIIDIGLKKEATLTFENKNEYKNANKNYFDAIVADVPCTGSGTWARTPEQAYYFTETMLAEYVAKQQTIVSNIVYYLKPGGTLYYITCSVFEAENEGQLEYFKSLGLEVKEHHLLEGWKNGADSMFIAVLVKV